MAHKRELVFSFDEYYLLFSSILSTPSNYGLGFMIDDDTSVTILLFVLAAIAAVVISVWRVAAFVRWVWVQELGVHD